MRLPSRRLPGQSGEQDTKLGDQIRSWLAIIRRAFHEFLALPTAMMAGFLLLALAAYYLDRVQVSWLVSGRDFIARYLFPSPSAMTELLSTIATGVLTVTSITITLLLLVLQQSAGNLGAQVFDQFLRRRENQFHFGYFIGLSLYSVLMLSMVSGPFNPIFGGLLALLGTIIGLFLLLTLFYTTVNQMTPVVIIEAIHTRTLSAYERHQELVQKTRRSARLLGTPGQEVNLPHTGYVTAIDLEPLAEAIERAKGEVEIEFVVRIGSFVSYREKVAAVRALWEEDLESLSDAVRRAIGVDRQRNLDTDAALGIEQIEMIAWTSISSAKQNPAPGIDAILYLADLLHRLVDKQAKETEPALLPVVYNSDPVSAVFITLETLAVAAVESMQVQSYATVVYAVVGMLQRMAEPYQKRTAEVVHRILPGLTEQMLTTQLRDALGALAVALRDAEQPETARRVESVLEEMSENY